MFSTPPKPSQSRNRPQAAGMQRCMPAKPCLGNACSHPMRYFGCPGTSLLCGHAKTLPSDQDASRGPSLRSNGCLEEIHRILHRSQPSDLRLIDIHVEGILQHCNNFNEVDRSSLQIVDEPRRWDNLLRCDIEDL